MFWLDIYVINIFLPQISYVRQLIKPNIVDMFGRHEEKDLPVADGSIRISAVPFLWVIHQARLLLKGNGGSPWGDSEPGGRRTF